VADEKRKLVRSSNEFVDDVRGLRQMEAEKRKEPISTERFHELAEDITEKSRDIMQRAVFQEDLGNHAPTGDVSIDDLSREASPDE